MRRLAVLLCVLSLSLAACRDQNILEQIGFIRSIAFDSAGQSPEGEQLLEVTISIPKSNQQEKLTLSTVARTAKEARMRFNRQNNRKLVNGQMRNILFGLEVTRKGAWRHLDTLLRDPSVGSKIHVIIVDGKAKDLIAANYPHYPSTGEYIDKLMHSVIESSMVPEINMYSFTRDLFDDGIDPVAPMLKAHAEAIEVTGIALFRGEQYAGQIPAAKGLLLSMLRTSSPNGEMMFQLEGEGGKIEHVMLGSMSNKRTVHVYHRNGRDIELRVDLEIGGSILEYTGKLSSNHYENQRRLERMMTDYVKREAEAMIRSMQEKKVDPFGFGQYVRNRIGFKAWQGLNWHETFPDVKVTVNPKVRIKESGKMEI
ncbi:Ger(x)C family spore germination protein [Paenibacillus dendritiformis]|uniref:Ger(x)C family spore germination protein n=1 Tax=Paenibacillus dendritiformis TaxID=130049 RepID=UPI00143DC21D|nr:Ger(x)C family spore germination protein [Paenibacillus dendritiformis]NKI19913.1 Ger(x)C family spore germination protein [Paenibacillus dendritiformis]NRG00244.1 Ger(x)C family spore germination protein [Paenibacillus dendritiformis]